MEESGGARVLAGRKARRKDTGVFPLRPRSTTEPHGAAADAMTYFASSRAGAEREKHRGARPRRGARERLEDLFTHSMVTSEEPLRVENNKSHMQEGQSGTV